MRAHGGCHVNTSMPCLDHYHTQLRAHVSGVERGNVASVSNLYCPALLWKNKRHIHRGNRTFVGVQGEEVYVRCSVCGYEGSGDGQEYVLPVAGAPQPMLWARLNRDQYPGSGGGRGPQVESTWKKKKTVHQ